MRIAQDTVPKYSALDKNVVRSKKGYVDANYYSRFLGIIIAMYWDDHSPPHFHAKYGGFEITVNILILSCIQK